MGTNLDRVMVLEGARGGETVYATGGTSSEGAWTTGEPSGARLDGRVGRSFQNFPLWFFHSDFGATDSIVSQCSTTFPSAMRKRS